METRALEGGGKIRIARTEIDIPHRGEIVTFVTPLVGPNNYPKVMGEIDSQGLLRPTTAQTFSLLNIALQNEDEPGFADLLRIFRDDYLWTSTRSTAFPGGVLVYDDIDGTMPSDSVGLLKLIEVGDKRVRLVKLGFKTRYMPISDLLKNPYLVAQVGGEDMLPIVEKVAKAVDKKETYIHGVDHSEVKDKRYTALDGYGGGLGVDGDYRDGDGDGRAFGVLKTGEASRAESEREKR